MLFVVAHNSNHFAFHCGAYGVCGVEEFETGRRPLRLLCIFVSGFRMRDEFMSTHLFSIGLLGWAGRVGWIGLDWEFFVYICGFVLVF